MDEQPHIHKPPWFSIAQWNDALDADEKPLGVSEADWAEARAERSQSKQAKPTNGGGAGDDDADGEVWPEMDAGERRKLDEIREAADDEFIADFTPAQRKSWDAKVKAADEARAAGGNVVSIGQGRAKRKPKPPPPPPPGGWPPWYGDLRRDERGRIHLDLRNSMIALRGEVGTRDAFHFDEMAQDTLVVAQPPLAPDAHPSPPTPHALTDDDVSRLQEWMQHVGMPRIGRETVGQAIDALAREHRFHPLRDYLDDVTDRWDGEPRLATWLHECLGAPDDEYHRLVGTMFLISMVARIYQPGCKADYMLVLEGDQGVLKSTVCRILAGEAYFSDSLPSVDGDQVRLSMHMKGKWLIEIAELAAMLRADPEGTKQFITRQVEKYTPKYARREVTEPRQWLPVGTTNEDDWIRDVTGGRRFWPVIAVKILIEKLVAMRDQLLGEAVTLYREGKPWWPNPDEELRLFKPEQDQRQFEDALADKVREILAPHNPKTGEPWLPGTAPKGQEPLTEITLNELARLIGDHFDDPGKFDMRAQKRLAVILKRAGWKKFKKEGAGRVWRKQ